jgi:hypothetical protein
LAADLSLVETCVQWKLTWWSQAESNRRPLECHSFVFLLISMSY